MSHESVTLPVRGRLGLPSELLAALSLFVVYLGLGAYLSIQKGYLPGDALARLASAYLVFHGNQAKLSTIGFVWPPIPTLLIVPFTLLPVLVDSWLAVVIVSALSMALASVLVGRIALECGVTGFWRWLLVLLFAVNPAMVVFACNGLSEAVLVAVGLAAFLWLLRFSRTRGNGDLVIAATLFSLLPLVRYEMVLLTAAVGLLVGLETWSGSRRDKLARGSSVQGNLIAYSIMAAYPTILWAVASWQIMGSPIYFLVNDRSALSVSQIDLGGAEVTLVAALQLAFNLWTSLFPATALASLVAIAVGLRRRSAFLIALGLVPLVIPLFQGLLLSRKATVPLVRYYIMAIPLGYVVSLATVRALFQNGKRRDARVFRRALAALALLLVASGFATGMLLASGRYQDFEHETWLSLTSSERLPDQRIPETLAVGRRLAELVPPGATVLLDEYQFGYAALLGARNPAMFVNHTNPQYEQALARPWDFVDYVLVPRPEGRGALYAVNRQYPTLYSEGASWAVLDDRLPPSAIGWRLYKVRR